MTEKVLFVLAAMTGTGKSTLLTNALRYRVPIFGNEYDNLFQKTNIPSKYPDDGITFEERMTSGTWFNEMHIDQIEMLDVAPDSLVLHLELYWINHLLARTTHKPSGMEYIDIKILTNRTKENIANITQNTLLYEYLLSLPFFKKYDKVIINTLYAPFQTSQKQWNSRESKRSRLERSAKMRFVNENIYLHAEGEMTYNSIYKAWTRAVQRMNNKTHYFTEIVNGKMLLETYQNQLEKLSHIQ